MNTNQDFLDKNNKEQHIIVTHGDIYCFEGAIKGRYHLVERVEFFEDQLMMLLSFFGHQCDSVKELNYYTKETTHPCRG